MAIVPVRPKVSYVSGKAPLAADLTNGELAVNATDGVLYVKDDLGNVKEVGRIAAATFASISGDIADNADLVAAFEAKANAADIVTYTGGTGITIVDGVVALDDNDGGTY